MVTIPSARALARLLATLIACTAPALAALTLSAAPAAAATPCWKTLLNDWYGGRIDKVFPVSCYRDALGHLPTDVSTYSSAHDDIERALQAALVADRRKGTKITPTTPVPASGAASQTTTPPVTTTGQTTTGKKPRRHPTTTTTPTTPPLPGHKPDGGIAGGVQASSPSSVPVALIVLAGLAGLLIVAGGVGLALRRRRPRT